MRDSSWGKLLCAALVALLLTGHAAAGEQQPSQASVDAFRLQVDWTPIGPNAALMRVFPSTSGPLFVQTVDGALLVTENAGATWVPVELPPAPPDADLVHVGAGIRGEAPIAYARSSAGLFRAYVASNAALIPSLETTTLWRSTDAGETWSESLMPGGGPATYS